MDGSRFDDLARSLARPASRRRLLGAAALLAGAAAPVPDAAAKRRCSFDRCGGRRRCCAGLTCCDGACVDAGFDNANCGACGAACDGSATCLEGACACFRLTCGDACCGEHEACLDPGVGMCGACPAGGTIDDGAACGLNPEVVLSGCTCVTSVDDLTTCSSGWGVCVDCESDRECTLALGYQAVCVPATESCARWRTARACIDATCMTGGAPVPEPGQDGSGAPAGPLVRLGR